MHDRMRGRPGRMGPGMRMRDGMGRGFMPPRRGFYQPEMRP
jgi:hypothetical protein